MMIMVHSRRLASSTARYLKVAVCFALASLTIGFRAAHDSIKRAAPSSPSAPAALPLHARTRRDNRHRCRAPWSPLFVAKARKGFANEVDPADLPPGSVEADPLAPLIRTIARAADLRKASDVVALRVTRCTSLTEFVVLASGTSVPQNQAIAAAVADDVEEMHGGRRCLGNGVPEGTAESGWILLDYGEVMVHVMTPKSRLFYDLEGQWRQRGGEYMDLSDVLVGEEDDVTGIGGGEDDGRSMKERLDVPEGADPFWS